MIQDSDKEILAIQEIHAILEGKSRAAVERIIYYVLDRLAEERNRPQVA